MVLRQMIVQKYATNSQDLHFILSQASDLDSEIEQFWIQIQSYVAKKGSILHSFIDVDQNDGEIPEVRELIK